MDKESIFCTKCGAENILGSRFCSACGTLIRGISTDNLSQPSTNTQTNNEPNIPYASPDFISLTCPTCGGKLSVTSNMERFACGYCGSEHIVRRSGGTVSIEPVMSKLNQISEHMSMMGGGIDKMTAVAEKQAAEAAIKRLNDELEEISKKKARLYDNATTCWLIFGVSAVVLFFSLFILFIDQGETGMISVIFVPSALLGGLMTFLGLICVIATLSDKKKKMKEYDAESARKIAQLRHNKDIVDR